MPLALLLLNVAVVVGGTVLTVVALRHTLEGTQRSMEAFSELQDANTEALGDLRAATVATEARRQALERGSGPETGRR